MNISREMLETAIAHARGNAVEKRQWSWANAAERAGSYLRQHPVDLVGGALRMHSRTQPGIIYEATPHTCQCPAFVEKGIPCWHRAAARIVEMCLYEEDILYNLWLDIQAERNGVEV
jgi:hypothetical protein